MILDEIARKTKTRVLECRQKESISSVIRRAENMPGQRKVSFEEALSGNDISFICEVKKASPSKGVISADFDYINISSEYEKAGADAISVLTEPYYFLGRDEYLAKIAENVKIPVLCKDFTIDEYQIYQAKTLGASAVLLICALLEDVQLREFMQLCSELNISAIVEAHTREEVERALKSEAKIIGVNNRNLKTFEVDINTSLELKSFVPEGVLFVAESGIKTHDDIVKLRERGADAVLIGETLMKSRDKAAELQKLRKGV